MPTYRVERSRLATTRSRAMPTFAVGRGDPGALRRGHEDVDTSKPAWVGGFTRKTFTAMIEGVRDAAIGAGISAPERFGEGIRDLYRTAEPDGVFCYTFFKATAANA